MATPLVPTENEYAVHPCTSQHEVDPSARQRSLPQLRRDRRAETLVAARRTHYPRPAHRMAAAANRLEHIVYFGIVAFTRFHSLAPMQFVRNRVHMLLRVVAGKRYQLKDFHSRSDQSRTFARPHGLTGATRPSSHRSASHRSASPADVRPSLRPADSRPADSTRNSASRPLADSRPRWHGRTRSARLRRLRNMSLPDVRHHHLRRKANRHRCDPGRRHGQYRHRGPHRARACRELANCRQRCVTDRPRWRRNRPALSPPGRRRESLAERTRRCHGITHGQREDTCLRSASARRAASGPKRPCADDLSDESPGLRPARATAPTVSADRRRVLAV